jgi:hypothetical protein
MVCNISEGSIFFGKKSTKMAWPTPFWSIISIADLVQHHTKQATLIMDHRK